MLEFEKILNDLLFYSNASPRSGELLVYKKEISIYKRRFKDEKRNIGSRAAYRLLYIIDDTEKICIPFHLYHKKSGKKHKLDLSEKEKQSLEEMITDLMEYKKG